MDHVSIPIQNWAAVVGRWIEGEGSTRKYLGEHREAARPFGILVSDVRLVDGEVSVRIRFHADSGGSDYSGRVLLGYRSLDEPYYSVGLGGYDRAFVISHFDQSLGWRAVSVAGDQANLDTDRWYDLRVRVHGQRVIVEVDRVRVLEHTLDSPLPQGQVGLFGWGTRTIEFADPQVAKRDGTVFVVMQFSGPYQELYTDVIQPLAREFDLRAYHAGEVFGPGVILEDIVSGIVDAKIVIAEITPANQNVFYELGYAHALRKPTILLAERGKQLPFDISGYRCLFYENSIGGKRKVDEGLRKHFEAILRD